VTFLLSKVPATSPQQIVVGKLCDLRMDYLEKQSGGSEGNRKIGVGDRLVSKYTARLPYAQTCRCKTARFFHAGPEP
jgi:hypothetical protein